MTALSNQEIEGEAIQQGNLQIVPVSTAWKLTIPGQQGGLIWNRPTAVKVIHPDGQNELIPVVDVTRQAILFFAAIGLGFALIASLVQLKKR
jgi:hypothetical protein